MLNFEIDRVATEFEKKWSPNFRCFQEHLKQLVLKISRDS